MPGVNKSLLPHYRKQPREKVVSGEAAKYIDAASQHH